MALVTAALEAEEQVVGHIPHGLRATAADYYVNVTNTGAWGGAVSRAHCCSTTQLPDIQTRMPCCRCASTWALAHPPVCPAGTVDSDDVVLGFIVPPGAGTNGTPLQELFGFERVFVPAGASTGPTWVAAHADRHRPRAARAAHCRHDAPVCSLHMPAASGTAGQTVTVYLAVQARFFTQVQADGLRAAWPGDYTIRFGVRETAQHGMGLAEVRVTV